MTPLIEIDDVRVHFPVRGQLFGARAQLKAVDGVSLSIAPGETLGLVGESGCGKSTLGRTVVRLNDATGGSIRFGGVDVTKLRGKRLRKLRREMQIVFQDPLGSLNPRKTVEEIVGEGLVIQGNVGRAERESTVREMLELVGLRPEAGANYPHEFSGGQRQRIGIARALVMHPRFVVFDEPVSALDVSIQSQVLNLLVRLKRELGLTYLFIAHDLAVVDYLSDRIAVMYLGKIVELASSEDLRCDPLHPYTQALLAAVPDAGAAKRGPRPRIKGEPASPLHPPTGCHFRLRCPYAQDLCAEVEPPLVAKRQGRLAACHFVDALKPSA